MKSKKNFTGAIGAWLTNELHPANATYSLPNSNFSLEWIPFLPQEVKAVFNDISPF